MACVKLRDAFRIRSGHSFQGGIPDSRDGRHRVIRPKDILAFRDGGELLQCEVRVDVKAAKPLVGGEILVLSRGEYAAVVFDLPGSDSWVVPSSVLVLTPTTRKVLPRYVASFLNSPSGQRLFRSLGSFTTAPFVSASVLGEFTIPVPPMERQGALAELEEASSEYARFLRRRLELIHLFKNSAHRTLSRMSSNT